MDAGPDAAPEYDTDTTHYDDFYFAVVDNELGGENPSAPGENSGFRATLQAILNGTCI